MILLEYCCMFTFGAAGYGLIEVLWRGYTHWSMLLTGGACLCLIYTISVFSNDCYLKKCLMCAFTVTTAEFLVGLIVNVKLGWAVWDYSYCRYNLLGQICPRFSFYWFIISAPAVWACAFAHRMFGRLPRLPRRAL